MKSPLFSALLLTWAVLPAWGQSNAAPQARAEQIAQRLGLSEDQKTRIQGLRDQHRPEVRLKQEAVRKTAQALRVGLQDPSLPEPQVRALYESASEARLDLMLARRSVRLAVQTILSPEQRAQALAWRQRARAARGERIRDLRLAAGLTD